MTDQELRKLESAFDIVIPHFCRERMLRLPKSSVASVLNALRSASLKLSMRESYDITDSLPAALDLIEKGESYKIIVVPDRGHDVSYIRRTRANTNQSGGMKNDDGFLCTEFIVDSYGRLTVEPSFQSSPAPSKSKRNSREKLIGFAPAYMVIYGAARVVKDVLSVFRFSLFYRA